MGRRSRAAEPRLHRPEDGVGLDRPCAAADRAHRLLPCLLDFRPLDLPARQVEAKLTAIGWAVRLFMMPGDLVCDLVDLERGSDHRQVLRMFVNTIFWSAVAIAAALLLTP